MQLAPSDGHKRKSHTEIPLPTLRVRPETHKVYVQRATMIIIIMMTTATDVGRVWIPAQERPRGDYWPDNPSPGKGCHGRQYPANDPIRIRVGQNKRHAQSSRGLQVWTNEYRETPGDVATVRRTERVDDGFPSFWCIKPRVLRDTEC